jgi:diacylglycerol kinase (ATP)
MSRALLLFNPAARLTQDLLPQAEARLAELGLELIRKSVRDAAGLHQLIRRHSTGVDRVIGAGGDGTLNSVLQGIVGTGLPLAVLPLGTANNLARTLGIPDIIAEACNVAAHGSRRRIDLGWVNGRYFFTTASLGLSVQITEALTHATKRRWGTLAYSMVALRALSQARPFEAEISWNDTVRRTRTVQVVVGNGRYYGSALPVSDDARIDDARLDLYSLEVEHWWQLLGLIPALRRGRQREKRAVEAVSATAFEIRTKVPRDINVDGEICSQTPARFRLFAGALEVFAISGAAGTAGAVEESRDRKGE